MKWKYIAYFEEIDEGEKEKFLLVVLEEKLVIRVLVCKWWDRKEWNGEIKSERTDLKGILASFYLNGFMSICHLI